MVNLVLVSHSRQLAEAVVELARQVAAPSVKIAVAAGIGHDRREFGTDAIQICEAIQSVDTPDGVLVLMDLGSAVLSAEMALDFLSQEIRAHVHLCSAPLVEGALSAAIAAGLGTSIEGVTLEATGALKPKQDHLSSNVSEMVEANDLPLSRPLHSQPQSITLVVPNANGLHLRPAARFVTTIASYDAEVKVQKAGAGNIAVSGKSPNKLATLGIVQGDAITITAQGVQAQQALQALRELVESGFDEKPGIVEVARPLNSPLDESPIYSESYQGISMSEGIAIAPLRKLQLINQGTSHETKPPQEEWQRLVHAIEQTNLAIVSLHAHINELAGEKSGSIFSAHHVILLDDELMEIARDAIFTQGMSAESGWKQAIAAISAEYRSLPDPYLRQRAVDVEDVGGQVLAILSGPILETSINCTEPTILFCDEFTPTQVARFDPRFVVGLISATGSTTSHASILARALGFPAIADTHGVIREIPDGTVVGLDGTTGQVWIEPAGDVVEKLAMRRTAWLMERERLRKDSLAITTTQDSRRVEIAANISGLADANIAVANGAEAVGVLRTEFLYMTRMAAPTEDEQVSTLRQIAAAMGDRAVIVRTLDIGGDKSIPYLTLPMEANPFLGVRAIRLSLAQPELFLTQIRAILRAGVDNSLRILLPMITLVEELVQTRGLIERAHRDLASEGVMHTWPMQIGIMIETPAAALMAPVLAPLVDFFSIGTNDLTQYTLAAERGNPNLGHLSDALHPAVLRLIHEVVIAAHQNGTWAGVCGEVASDPGAIPILVGLGVDELSMNVSAIPHAKAIVRRLRLADVTPLAQAALKADSARTVRDLVKTIATGSGE